METPLDAEISSSGTPNGLVITAATARYLKEMGGWCKFLSIVGFVYLGLMVLMGLFMERFFLTMGTAVPAGVSGMVAIVYIAIALLLFFPCFYLLLFSVRIKGALAEKDPKTLEDALGYLKSHYKFVGILTAVSVGLFVISMAFMLLGLAMASR